MINFFSKSKISTVRFKCDLILRNVLFENMTMSIFLKSIYASSVKMACKSSYHLFSLKLSQ